MCDAFALYDILNHDTYAFCVYIHMILSCQSLVTYAFYLSCAFYSSCVSTCLSCVVICVYENDLIQIKPESEDDESEVSVALNEELSYLDFLCFPPMFNNLTDVPKFKNIKSKIFVSPTLYNYVSISEVFCTKISTTE